MRQPDIAYTDILPRDVDLYVNLEDEDCHELEATIGIRGDDRFNIKIWLQEEK